GDHEGLAASRDRLDGRARDPEDEALIREDMSEAAALAQGLGEGDRLREVGWAAAVLTGRDEGADEVVSDVEAFDGRGALRKLLQRLQCLFEAGDRLVIRRPGRRLEPRLSEIDEGLFPELPAHGVMCEPLDLLAEAVCVLRLDGSDDACVEAPAVLGEQAGVRDLLRQRV